MPVVDVDRLKEQGKRFVDGFTPGQKAMTILGVVAVVLAGMTFMKWAAKPDYAPLYTGLSVAGRGRGHGRARRAARQVQDHRRRRDDPGAAPGRRQDPHRPQRQEHPRRAATPSRCSTSRASPPTSSRATSTTSARCRASWARRSSRSTPSSAATVTLTIPQQTVFVGASEDKPTAAVLVKTTGGALSADTVNAIVHLVASSIPNMNPDDVTVADANGTVLHAPGMDTQLAGSSADRSRPRPTTPRSRRRSRTWSRARSAPATRRSPSPPTST